MDALLRPENVIKCAHQYGYVDIMVMKKLAKILNYHFNYFPFHLKYVHILNVTFIFFL